MGIHRDHDMVLVTPDNMNTVTVQDDDLIIFSNIRRFDLKRLATLNNPSVMFHHDTWCKYRLFYPRIPSKCLVRCPVKEDWANLFKKVKLHIFLSPLHYEIHREVFGDIVEPHINVPSPLADQAFKDLRLQRNDYCNVSGLNPFKGREPLLQWAKEHSDQRLSILGQNPDKVELPPNVRSLPPVPAGKMNDFYNAFKDFIHLPDRVDPFCRSIAEAYLAGCRITGNKNIGALSWPFFKEGRAIVERELLTAPNRFWEAIEKHVME